MGRNSLPESKKKKPFVLYFTDEEIRKAGGRDVALVKAAKAILGK